MILPHISLWFGTAKPQPLQSWDNIMRVVPCPVLILQITTRIGSRLWCQLSQKQEKLLVQRKCDETVLCGLTVVTCQNHLLSTAASSLLSTSKPPSASASSPGMAASWQGSEWGWGCNPIVFYKVSHHSGKHFHALCRSCSIMSSDSGGRNYKSSTNAGNAVSAEKVQWLPRWWSRSGAGCAGRELRLLIKKTKTQKCPFPLMNCGGGWKDKRHGTQQRKGVENCWNTNAKHQESSHQASEDELQLLWP